jgi:hypothetical protein
MAKECQRVEKRGDEYQRYWQMRKAAVGALPKK